MGLISLFRIVKMHLWLLLIIILLVNVSQAKGGKIRKGTAEYYAQGTRKDWSDYEFRRYRQWINSVLEKQYLTAGDDQVLRRQWAIISGNKITSEIWNFGSISSPGNKITDIVWEGLGYGYEFGPFVYAEVEVPYGSHLDTYIQLDSDGNPILVNMSPITDGASYEPYRVKWGTEIIRNDNFIILDISLFSSLIGSNIYNSNRAVSEQEGFYVPIAEISEGDTLLIELVGAIATFARVYIEGVEADELFGVDYTLITGSFDDFSENDSVKIHIFPRSRPLAAARVISEGLISYPETSPDNTEFWGWEPLAYSDTGVPYADPSNEHIPTSGDIDRDKDGKPDSWPEGWYNPNLKDYVWPGALKQGSSNADQEAFFVIDDRNNKEFEYYPFPDDSSRRGLGIEIECRYYQWSNPLAEDIIFLIYKVTNKSAKNLSNVIFGMWGDPHIGGPDNWDDDLSFFDRSINMVYAWDNDNLSDVAGRSPGYFGYKFLESPGNPYDGIDNDGDGLRGANCEICDESRSDGIDNDDDWDPEKDDVGIDGIPNTGDEGEGDGFPTAGDPFDIRKPGEPNFEWTDLDEADMVGLTGFAAPPFLSQNAARNDDYFYNHFLIPGQFDSTNQAVAGDYIFLYSSGPFDFPAGESRRFSIALLIGEDFEDLTLNAVTAQEIYERNYEFAKPPEKPNVVAVPGDEKVTLYWDDVAESSLDPITQEYDFEGYVIYRSNDPQFSDQQVITDAYGTKFLFEPLKMVTGAPAKFDLINEYSGFSTVPYTGRGSYYHLGNNTGLRHSFIDSNNVINGQTYYYAVVSYDHGDDSLQIAPVECKKQITVDPELNETIFDVNTLQVIPGTPAAGFISGHINNNSIIHTEGVATGSLRVEILDPRIIEDNNEFRITFTEDPLSYSVEDMKVIEDEFLAKHDQYIRLRHRNINDSTFVVKSMDGSTVFDTSDYALIPETGQIMAKTTGAILNNEKYIAYYRYFGVRSSTLFENEENNPIFDGMKIYVKGETLELDESRMNWNITSPTTYVVEVKPFNNNQNKKYPADYEVRWFSSIADSSFRPGFEYVKTNLQVWETTRGQTPVQKPMIILETVTLDSLWNPGERVIILQDSSTSSTSWEFTFRYPESGDTIPPVEGDVYYIATTRPFTDADVYSFTTNASRIDKSKAMSDLDKISVVPNPYVVTNVLERLDLQNRTDRGSRLMYFNHLPKDCTIRIYTLNGELVDILEHHSDMDDGKEFWDLTTQDNFPIAYGVYIYHVDAGEIGEKIGRFGVIK